MLAGSYLLFVSFSPRAENWGKFISYLYRRKKRRVWLKCCAADFFVGQTNRFDCSSSWVVLFYSRGKYALFLLCDSYWFKCSTNQKHREGLYKKKRKRLLRSKYNKRKEKKKESSKMNQCRETVSTLMICWEASGIEAIEQNNGIDLTEFVNRKKSINQSDFSLRIISLCPSIFQIQSTYISIVSTWHSMLFCITSCPN